MRANPPMQRTGGTLLCSSRAGVAPAADRPHVMPTQEPTFADLQEAFRRHGVEPPAEYRWIVTHRMLGFEPFSQFEPWFLCGVEEITPLSKLWPSVRLENDLIPFARDQTGDDLACLELRNGTVCGTCEIHYDLGPPLYVELGKRHPGVWEWLHSALDDVKFWSGIKR